MKAEDFEKEFKSMPVEDQLKVMRNIMPLFCENMMRDPKGVRDMFSLLTQECGDPMANMVSIMGMMMGRKGGGCCG